MSHMYPSLAGQPLLLRRGWPARLYPASIFFSMGCTALTVSISHKPPNNSYIAFKENMTLQSMVGNISFHVGPLTSFLDADKDVSSTMIRFGGRTSPTPGARQPSYSQSRERGGAKFTPHELKVLR